MEKKILAWNLSDCSSRLRELVLGNDCLQYVKKLKLVGFANLERVEMGSGCYSESDGSNFSIQRRNSLLLLRESGEGGNGKWLLFGE